MSTSRPTDTRVLDEAHERSLTIDFLLGWLKHLLLRHPDLKVVVSSATIETERFSQFFGGALVIQVEDRTFPVGMNVFAFLFHELGVKYRPVKK